MVIAFFAACVLIGLSVISSVHDLPFVETYNVKTPSEAVKAASNAKSLKACAAFYNVKEVKSIDGLEKPQDDDWEVTYSRNDLRINTACHSKKSDIQVFIDAKTGETF